MFVSASLTTLFVFAAFVGTGGVLNAENAFVVLALINGIRFSMNMLPMGVKCIVEAKVAVQRVQAFLEREELPTRSDYVPLSSISPETPVIEVEDGDFSWDTNGPVALKGVNLRVPRGQLVAVVGPVGSGKSTLLAAIMEQVHFIIL